MNVLVDKRRDLHGDLECLLDFDLVEKLRVLLESFFESFEKSELGFGKTSQIDLRNLLFIFEVDELQNAVAQVANVVEQFLVVLLSKIVPREDGVRAFGAIDEQVVAPNLWRNADVLRTVSEDSGAFTL